MIPPSIRVELAHAATAVLGQRLGVGVRRRLLPPLGVAEEELEAPGVLGEGRAERVVRADSASGDNQAVHGVTSSVRIW